MMKSIKRISNGKSTPLSVIILFIFIFSFFQSANAQQQLSVFTVSGWTPGTTPIYTGSNSNVVNLNYGENLNTTVGFTGYANDGLGTDFDNIAYMSFSYSYTIYLTLAGQAFSTTTSIPIATHTISAYQSCSSGITPPWTIGCDAQPTTDTNKLDMNTADVVNECVPVGNYQVDVVFNTYTLNSVGPNPPAIDLVWSGYTNNSSIRGLSFISAPSSSNNSGVALNPATSYILSQIAFVHVGIPQTCPPIALTLPRNIQTFATTSSATVVASYPGQCAQNPCSYLWSNGETTATAINLTKGIYTVTVTTPCGNMAIASVIISNITDPNISEATPTASLEMANYSDHATLTVNNIYKKATANTTQDNAIVETQMTLYPNPARHNITFDLKAMMKDLITA